MDYLTINEAAQQLGLNPWTLRRLFDQGRLPRPRRLGERRVISPSDIPMLKERLQQLRARRGKTAATAAACA
jgi:excisionase family DNA binding protein